MNTGSADWTVIIYIAAHNNLDLYGERSLNQILSAGSTPHVKLVALFDGTQRAARYIAGAPGTPAVQENLDSFDSGDGDALLETVRWACQQYPAQRYALILWSHGSGWRPEPVQAAGPSHAAASGKVYARWTPTEIQQIAREARGDTAVDVKEATERSAAPGSMALFRSTMARILSLDKPAERAVCFDDGTGHSLDTLELDRVMQEVQKLIGHPLDLLGMDACLMATLEVAYQIRKSVRYLVASEELVPARSWPYDSILQELNATPDMEGNQLAAAVVRHYKQFYQAHPPPPGGGDVTKVALDLSRIGEIVGPVNALASALTTNMDHEADRLWAFQVAAFEQESRQRARKSNKFQFHLWDIGTLAARLVSSDASSGVVAAAQAVTQALKLQQTAVLAEDHIGEWFAGIGGLTIYMPLPKRQRLSSYSSYYEQVALALDTAWNDLLRAYHAYYA